MANLARNAWLVCILSTGLHLRACSTRPRLVVYVALACGTVVLQLKTITETFDGDLTTPGGICIQPKDYLALAAGMVAASCLSAHESAPHALRLQPSDEAGLPACYAAVTLSYEVMAFFAYGSYLLLFVLGVFSYFLSELAVMVLDSMWLVYSVYLHFGITGGWLSPSLRSVAALLAIVNFMLLVSRIPPACVAAMVIGGHAHATAVKGLILVAPILLCTGARRIWDRAGANLSARRRSATLHVSVLHLSAREAAKQGLCEMQPAARRDVGNTTCLLEQLGPSHSHPPAGDRHLCRRRREPRS